MMRNTVYGNEKQTVKELMNDIFGKKNFSSSESKPIEKRNIGEPLNTFHKDNKSEESK